jgi:hypothetical protein
MIGMTPPFQVYVAYISTIPDGLSALLAVAAALLSHKALVAGSDRRSLWSIFAIILLIGSLCLYQIATFYYWALMSVTVLTASPRLMLRHTLPRLLYCLGLLSVAVVSYYACWRLGLLYYNVSLFGKYDARMFVQDPIQRIGWFFNSALFEASNLWSINPTLSVAALVAVLTVIGACSDLISRDPYTKGFYRVAIAIGKTLVLFSFFPAAFIVTLADVAPSAEYRTYISLEALFVLFMVLGLWRLTKQRRVLSDAVTLGVSVLTLGALFVSNSNLTSYFVIPDSLELRHMRNEFIRAMQTTGQPIAGVHVVRLPRPVAPEARNEIGEPSAVAGQNIRPMVMAAVNGLATSDLRVAYSDHIDDPRWIEWGTVLSGLDLPKAEIAADQTWAVIDMSSLTSDSRVSDD